ncbi:MAG: hypothetical protein ACOCRZ_03460 [Halothermotrichaceae bacterium]
MTHTLHRRGDRDSLSRDFVFLMMPSKDINHENSAPKLKKFFQLALKNGSVKIGNCRNGNEYFVGGVEEVLESVEDRAVIHAVFTEKDKVKSMLRDLKEEDIGLSVVLSGLLDEVDQCCKEEGVQRHTVNESVGIWGNTDLLPDEKKLQINTMCGHGMVTVNLINDVVDKIEAGKLTIEEGAEELFKPCMCGIFNPERAEELLEEIVDK